MVSWSDQTPSDYDALDNHIKEEFKESEQRIVAQVKLWILTGMLALSITLVGGFTVLVYQVGRVSERFELSMSRLVKIEDRGPEIARWRTQKDVLDDDMIRWARQRGYEPPTWYDATIHSGAINDE